MENDIIKIRVLPMQNVSHRKNLTIFQKMFYFCLIEMHFIETESAYIVCKSNCEIKLLFSRSKNNWFPNTGMNKQIKLIKSVLYESCQWILFLFGFVRFFHLFQSSHFPTEFSYSFIVLIDHCAHFSYHFNATIIIFYFTREKKLKS